MIKQFDKLEKNQAEKLKALQDSVDYDPETDAAGNISLAAGKKDIKELEKGLDAPEAEEDKSGNKITRFFKTEKKMDEKAVELLKVFELDESADTLASNLPYGKQRKLEIARAIATNPKLLLLDEPAAGMNPNETKELMDTIKFVRDHFDLTVLVIEHDMSLVSGICEEITVLNFGTELAKGKTDEVLKNPEVVKAYLGQ